MKFYYSDSHLLLLLSFMFIGCSGTKNTNFVLLDSSDTNISFSNTVENTPEFNVQNYLYFYDGGGVAVGDINNDGLPDLFFTGSDVPNRLYLNRGNFEFEDITASAGINHVSGSWSTGVTMADVNGDHYLDIYVSQVNFLNKKGPNRLYINNGDLTFTEKAAEYGLDLEGYSTQASFFDYNNDGRLDLFQLNHSFHSQDTYGQADRLRQKVNPKAGDKLFRNDGDHFTEVTEEAGIYSSALGYGLGLSITDINRDGFMDIYVGNDFHESDYFYINNGDGTFTESLYDMIGHTSGSSMGDDIGDINNDGLTDIISLDMMPKDHETRMRSGGPDLVIIANAKKRFGFGEYNKRNTLQVNRGTPAPDALPVFSETALASGIVRTEWSWSALLADYDNDGFQDLYITNGIPHRPNDLDYVSALQQVRQKYSGAELEKQAYALIDLLPSVYESNYMFKNNGDLTFENVTSKWGLKKPSYTNGTAYADLNNDGKLDLILNNMNDIAVIYQNNIADNDSTNYLKVKLRGDGMNTSGIGTKVILYNQGKMQYREMTTTHGFQSSMDHVLHFGLGTNSRIDSLLVIWPDRRYEVLENIKTNLMLDLKQSEASGEFDYSRLKKQNKTPLFTNVSDQIGIDYKHKENAFDDFSREPLMPYKLSTRGPAMAIGDVTGNGLDDVYMGGSRGFVGKLFLQQKDGSFVDSQLNDFEVDRTKEDVDAIFFDATGDGLLDLYVVSGGNEYIDESVELIDRLYINQGNGEFRKTKNSIPEFSVNGSVACAADIDGDGDLDLFVGGHSIPWKYGIGPQSFIFENNGNGEFRDMTEKVAPEVKTIGNVTSAVWIQNPGKPLPDLVIAGEWMTIQYFENQDGMLVKTTEKVGLDDIQGLWQSLYATDLTGNGYPDLIGGNFGINGRLRASADSPVKLYVNDYNDNGQTAPVISYFENGEEKPFEQLDEILSQIPEVQQAVKSYRDYASKNLRELFKPAKLDSALQKKIVELRSMVLLNDGMGNFAKKPFPIEAQLFPVMAIYSDDINGDGIPDILIGGNLYDVKPSMGGRQDAGFGLVLIGKGDGEFKSVQFNDSDFFVNGEARSIQSLITNNSSQHVIVARNNDTPLIFRVNQVNN